MSAGGFLRFACLVILPGVCSSCAAPAGKKERAGDWPAWRGERRDGICREKGLLQKWPEGGPKLLWKATGLGAGYSGPAIVGPVLHTMGNRDGQETVLALDTGKRGEIAWRTGIGPADYGDAFPGTRSTPTVDGGRVYALGTTGRLVSLDAKGGGIVWRRSFADDFGGVMPKWGYAESVLVDGDLVICTPGGPEASIAALDKATGRTVWASKLGDRASYSWIIRASACGVDQYVAYTADGVVGVRAADGGLLWRYKEPDHTADWGDVNVMTPVWSGESVFASAGYNTGGGRARIVGSASGLKSGAGGARREPPGLAAEQVWFTEGMANHHGGLVFVNGYLYGATDPGDLRCLDFETGEIKWSTREAGKCSVLYADGMLYCRSAQGQLSLVRAKPDGFELRGRFEQPSRSKEKAWPHLVIADGRLYVRDQDVLLCYDVRAGE